MRKNLKKGLALIVGLSMLTGLMACGKSAGEEPDQGGQPTSTAAASQSATPKPTESEQPKEADKEITSEGSAGQIDGTGITIGWSVPTAQEEIWVKDTANVEKYAKEAGCEIITQQANLDVDRQISQIQNLITQGIDVLIVGPVDNSSLGPVLTEVHEAGIPIVAFVRNALNCPLDAMITYDFYEMTEANSAYAVEKKPTGNYVIVGGDLAQAPDTNELQDGMLSHVTPLADKGDVKIVLEQNVVGWKAETAMAMVENALAMTDNDLSAVLCANDGMAYGVVQALEDAGLDGQVVVTGHDGELKALQLIAQGKMSATAFKSSDMFCSQAVEIAVKLAKGEELKPDYTFNNGYMDVPSFKAPFLTVTTENIDELIIDGGFYTKDEIYGEIAE